MKTVGTRRIVIQERKKREKRQRIDSIINAAKRIFFAKGYLKTTMDEIALEAEISKPTIYQFFKTKDDLFFSLMSPVIDDIGKQMERVEQKLLRGEYTTGDFLVRDLFRAFYHSYELSPDTFRIVQLFQQTGLLGEFGPNVKSALDEKGRYNFELGRRIIRKGIEIGLLKQVNEYELADLIWGLNVGVIQLEDIKSDHKRDNRFKKAALKLAEDIFVAALAQGKPSTV
jgi:TetR/AcrR family transcriptional regulator, fatty acid metabolism regulator protein